MLTRVLGVCLVPLLLLRPAAHGSPVDARAVKTGFAIASKAVTAHYRDLKPGILRRVFQPKRAAALLKTAHDTAVAEHGALLDRLIDSLGADHPATRATRATLAATKSLPAGPRLSALADLSLRVAKMPGKVEMNDAISVLRAALRDGAATGAHSYDAMWNAVEYAKEHLGNHPASHLLDGMLTGDPANHARTLANRAGKAIEALERELAK